MSQPSSSACYCGCNTKRNQLLWGLAVGLGVVAGICCIIFIVAANSCNNFEVSGCNSAAAFFWIFILFAIGSSIPCYMMCCCSNPPQHERKLVVAAPAAPHTVVHATVVNAPPPHMHQSPYDARGVPVGVPPPPPPPGAVPVGPPQPPPHTAVQMPPPPPPKMM